MTFFECVQSSDCTGRADVATESGMGSVIDQMDPLTFGFTSTAVIDGCTRVRQTYKSCLRSNIGRLLMLV
jgi:hypothetical protein